MADAPAPTLTPTMILRVPMRDGVSLHTEVHLPARRTSAPLILMRTPYPDSIVPFALRPIQRFVDAGYAVAVQSCRGTWHSEGNVNFFGCEAEDGYDAIEWLALQAWCNGKVGMYGSSYGGSVQLLAATLRPPHLTAIAPQSPGAMFFEETPFVGGVLRKDHLLLWPYMVSSEKLEGSKADLPDPVEDSHPVMQAFRDSPNAEVVAEWHKDCPMGLAMLEALEHPTLDDWWARRMVSPEQAAGIDIPILAITGFHDGDQMGALYCWDLIEAGNSSGRADRRLLIGPWRHAQMANGNTAQMGKVEFADNADMDLPGVILDFYDQHLCGNQSQSDCFGNRCRLYTTGPGNAAGSWHDAPEWPPGEPMRWWLRSNGKANSLFGDGRLEAIVAAGAEAADLLHANWRLPVPDVEIGGDARAIEVRNDVLVYTSDPLKKALTVLGPVSAELWVSADAVDCDLVVRLEDVHPDGTAVLMTGEQGFGARRARYREGFDREIMLVPGEPARVPVHVCHMGHTFGEGHCLRISICATVKDVLEPNHHTGEPVLTAVKRRPAVQFLHHDSKHPSALVLPILASAAARTIE